MVNVGTILGIIRFTDEASATVATVSNNVRKSAQVVDDASKQMTRAFKDAELGNKGLQDAIDRFSGTDAVGKASAYANAVSQIGGAAKLTAAEQAEVNRTVNEAIEKYQALGQQVPADLRMLADETKKLDTENKGATLSFKELVAGYVTAQAVWSGTKAAVGAVVDFIDASVKSYANAESAQKKLSTAIQSSGRDVPSTIKQYNDLASQFQRTTVYSDDLVNEMEALFTEVGNVGPAQMDDALSAATNLASGLGIDLQQAVMLVGKAFEGETGTLKRYGIVIDDAALKTGGANAVMAAIQQRFGGQAAAEVDTYAGRVKQLSNAWDNVQEAVGAAIVNDPLIVQAMKRIGEETTHASDAAADAKITFTEWLVGAVGGPQARDAVRYLTDIAAAAEAADAGLRRAQEQAKGFQSAAPSRPNTFGNDLVDEGAVLNTWLEQDRATKQLAASITEQAKAWAGLNAVEKANQALQSIRQAQGTYNVDLSKMDRKAQDEINASMKAALDVYKAWGQTAPKAVVDTYNATWDLNKALDDLKVKSLDSLKGIGTAFQADLMPAVIPAIKVIDGLPLTMTRLGKTIETGLMPPTQEWGRDLDELSQSLLSLGRASGGVFGDMVADIGGVISAFTQATKATQAFKDNGGATTAQKLGAFTAGAADVIAGTSQGSTLQRTIGGAAAGASAGMAVGAAFSGVSMGLSIPVGAGIGALVGFARGKLAKTQGKKDLEAANAEIDKIKANLLAQYGSVQALDAAAKQVGLTFSDAWGAQNVQGLKDFSKLADELADRQQRLADATDKYGIKFGQLNEEVRKSKLADWAADLQKTITVLSSAGVSQPDIVKGMAADLNDFVNQAIRSGTKIPAAMQPVIDTLIRTGQLTDENRRLMLGLADTSLPSLQDITDAAGRYGISLDALGPKVAQLRVDDWAKQLIADWQMLSGLGGDTNAILAGMAPKVQDLVTAAIRAGSEIPAGMRPIIQQMVDLGLLTDDNGDKLEDLGRLNFAQSLEDSVGDLIAKMSELIDKLTGPNGVAAGLSQIGRGVEVPVRYRVEGDVPSGTATARVDTGENSFANGTDGYQYFGSGTLATLHGWEKVTPKGGDSGAGDGGRGGTLIVQSVLEGRVLAEVLVPYIPGALKAAGIR